MRNKKVQQVVAVATPHLQPDERIEVIAFANVGRVSIKRKVATTAVVGALTGGMLIVNVRPRKTYLTITGQRLVFFNADTAIGRPGKLLFTLPRALVTISEAKKGVLMMKADLAVEGQDQGLRLTFPRVAFDDGDRVLSVLRAQVTGRRGDRSR
jgi:hypothetical protein